MAGSSRLELIGIVYVTVLSFFLKQRKVGSILSTFILTVMPQYLVVQFPALIPFFALAFTLCLALRRRESKGVPDIRDTISMMRTVLMMQTTTCILLYDFKSWIARFGKTSEYGISLMDLGIGGFIFNYGLLSSLMSTSRLLRSCCLQLALGFIRLATIRIFSLDVDPSEYGYHWNFYFTMAVLNCFSLLFRMRRKFWTGGVILFLHEYLAYTLAPTVLSSHRKGFILENKEGLFSIMPSLGVLLILNSCGEYILREGVLVKNMLFLACCTKLAAGMHLLSLLYSEPSRRLMNLGFTSWVLMFYLGFMCLASSISYFWNITLKDDVFLNFVSRNSFLIFIFSNVLVLLFKILFPLGEMPFFSGSSLFVLYLVLNFIMLPIISRAIIAYCSKRVSCLSRINKLK